MQHWKETNHSYAMHIRYQWVWDYVGDTWVHRLIQKEGKMVDLPASTRARLPSAMSAYGDSVASQQKNTDMAVEYGVLLSQQMESMRKHWEEQVEIAANKAAKAATDETAGKLAGLSKELNSWKAKCAHLRNESKRRENEAASAKKEAADAKALAAKNAQENAAMENKMNDILDTVQKRSDKVEELESELARMKDINEKLQARIKTLEDEVTQFQEEIKRLKEEEKRLTSQAASSKDLMRTMTTRLKEAEKKLQDEETLNQQLLERNRHVTAKYEAAERERNKALSLLEEAHKEAEELRWNITMGMQFKSKVTNGEVTQEEVQGAQLGVQEQPKKKNAKERRKEHRKALQRMQNGDQKLDGD
jgi:chromosome segregation ATPase